MKKILKISFVFLLVLGFVSCSGDDGDTLTGNNNTGGLISVKNAAVAYVVGNGNTFEYAAAFSAFQGPTDATKIATVDVYKQFTSVTDGTSNKVLLKSFIMPVADQYEYVDFTFTYEELIDGILVDGLPVSSSDANLNIGDSWVLTYETTTVSGDLAPNAKTTKVSVGTRFAGSYRCLTGFYYRIGVLTYTESVWPSFTIIESVDAITYRVKTFFGPFNNTSTLTGGDFYFTIDSSDVIAYPATTPDGIAQEGNTQPFITCSSNPGDMTNVDCAGSNIVVRDNVNGADKLYMTFGYLASSGSREFYQVMEKIVD